jgi:transcription initiation factor TFIID TATA-box-binding protein
VIQNMVFTADLGASLNLTTLARFGHDRVELNPHKFASAIFRASWPKTTSLLFSTGRIVITGCKTRWCAHIAVSVVLRMLRVAGIAVRFRNLVLQNVVGSAAVGVPLDIDHLASVLQEEGSHETDLFPGLVYRPYGSKVACLCFRTGKMVITGCRTEQELHEAVKFVHHIRAIADARAEAVRADPVAAALAVHTNGRRTVAPR